MLALGRRMSQYEVAMQCYTRRYPSQHDPIKPCTRYVVQSSTYRALSHALLSYTVYSVVISYLRCNTQTDRRQQLSSCQAVNTVRLPTCSCPQIATVSRFYLCGHQFQYCQSCSRCYTSTERPQPVTLVQPSNRSGYDKVPYTDVFHSLEQAQIVSETVDDPYHTNVQTSTRHLGNIATFPTSCDTSAPRQLLVFPSSTACIATDSNAQLNQHDTVPIDLTPVTRGIYWP